MTDVVKPCHCQKGADVKCSNDKIQPLILVHCGAGDVPDDLVPKSLNGVKNAVRAALKVLIRDGSAVDAVEAAVRSMEDDENLNAGHGAVLNIDGNVEMSASIMSGEQLNAGAVAFLKNIGNPIGVARKVMDDTPHVMLVGEGALKFAEKHGFKVLPDGDLVTPMAKRDLEKHKRRANEGKNPCAGLGGGTVGAVALDKFGHLAAATSTGGLTGALPGRVGDTPQIGSGTYADDKYGAVSLTGHGESILKVCVAHSIITQLKSSMSPQQAAKYCIDGMTSRLENTAGSIVISPIGEIGIYHSTKRMPWAYSKVEEGTIKFGAEYDNCEEEPANIDDNICNN